MRRLTTSTLLVLVPFTAASCVNWDAVPTACSTDPTTCLRDGGGDGAGDSSAETYCVAGELSCSGQQLMKCDGSGGSRTPYGEPCAADTICDAKGSGQCDICKEDAVYCGGLDGAILRHCASDGQSFTTIDTCATKELCAVSTLSGCTPPACATGEKRCSGLIAQKCNAGRTAYDVVATCGVLCASGDCVTVAALSSAGPDTCARMTIGSPRCWGANTVYGELGDGTKIARPAPALTLIASDALAVSLGYDHGCAIMADRTVQCWGGNIDGQLGDGTTTPRETPAPVTGLKDVLALASGLSFTCATTAEEIWCWGANSNGQCGDGSSASASNHTTPVKASVLGAEQLVAGRDHVCARFHSTVSCWGGNAYGQVGFGAPSLRDTPGGLAIGPVSFLEAGAFFTCAIRESDGAVWCWGDNAYGQFGDGGSLGATVTTPTLVPSLTGFIEIASGLRHSCGRKSDGGVSCWGDNGYGQLGDGGKSPHNTPKPVPGLSLVSAIAIGANHSCALITGGIVKCWGIASSVGSGLGVDAPSPTIPRW